MPSVSLNGEFTALVGSPRASQYQRKRQSSSGSEPFTPTAQVDLLGMGIASVGSLPSAVLSPLWSSACAASIAMTASLLSGAHMPEHRVFIDVEDSMKNGMKPGAQPFPKNAPVVGSVSGGLRSVLA